MERRAHRELVQSMAAGRLSLTGTGREARSGVSAVDAGGQAVATAAQVG